MELSIIIINWNTQELLSNCLSSIYRTIKEIAFEIILVDNGSEDGSVPFVKKHFSSVKIIANTDNRGFGRANNQALEIMEGRYALLLNTDTVLTPHAVAQLYSFMESTPDAAMACGQLLNSDGSKQNSIAAFPTLLTLIANTSLLEHLFPKRFPSKRYHHHEPVEVDSGIGACLLVRKAAIDDVGMFDERYFFFFEETDWAYQMHRKGWKTYHVPNAHIYHLQGQSIGPNIRSRIEFYRSRYIYFRKWKGSFYNTIVRIAIAIRLIINWLSSSIASGATLCLRRNILNRWILYSGLILWHLKGCPESDLIVKNTRQRSGLRSQ